MTEKPTDRYEFLFLFSLAIVFGAIALPTMGGICTLPGWLILMLTPVGWVLYIAIDATLTNLYQKKGAVLPFTVFVLGSIISAMMLRWLQWLLS